MIKTIIFGLIAASAVILASAELACKDEKGKDVDWFVVYKLPYQKDSPAPLNTGYSYAFMTGKPLKGSGKEETSSWKLSNMLTTDAKSIFGTTLAPLHSAPKKYTHIMYNDAPPEESGVNESGSRAHAKGVLAMDKESGFWLIHSVPKFAQIPTKKYEYPESGKNNGQTALCISFKTKDEGEDIVTQLKYMGINMYDFEVTKEVDSIVKNIHDLKASRQKLPDTKRTTPVDSVGGTSFTSFARTKKGAGDGDLYEKFVAPKLGNHMFVETWRRGAGNPLNSTCHTDYKVNNINAMKIKFSKDSKLPDSSDWSYIKDHSKWGMSDSSKSPYVCIGDINRMASQNSRGGGTVCVKNSNLWQRFRESVHELDPCPLHPKGKGRSLENEERSDKKPTPRPVGHNFLHFGKK